MSNTSEQKTEKTETYKGHNVISKEHHFVRLIAGTRLSKGRANNVENDGFTISYELDVIDENKISKFYIMAKNKAFAISSDITIEELELMLTWMKNEESSMQRRRSSK